jgi:hypothetical protein
MTVALLVYWVLPVLIFAIGSRFVVYTGPAVQPLGQSKPVALNMEKMHSQATPAPTPKKEGRKSTPMPTLLSNKPTSYQEVRTPFIEISK